MKSYPPLLRSRTAEKLIDVQLDHYKARDWGYQSPKHQVKPHFVLGKSKKRSTNLAQKDFSVFRNPIPWTTYGFYKRELKPAMFRCHTLSQIANLPGAVKVDESQIKDDKSINDKIRVNRNKRLRFLNKLMNNTESNVGFFPGSKNLEAKKENSINNIIEKKEKDEKEKNKKKNEKNKNKKKNTFSPIRNRMKRKNKIK